MSINKKSALGGGLDALLDLNQNYSVLSETEIKPTSEIPSGENQVFYLSLEFIHRNSEQPRTVFNDDSLAELADSIKQRGVIQPILVEKLSTDNYQIVAGERRFRAAGIAGLKVIPAIVKSFSVEEKMEIALIENVQREDLTPIEEAVAYKHLMDSMMITQQDVADKIGKKRSTVANSLRLLKLPNEMQDSINRGEISAGHARAILSLANPADHAYLYKKIMDEGLSVRETEKSALALNSGIKNVKQDVQPQSTPPKDPNLMSLEQQFIEKLGTKVQIKGSASKGRLEIEYFSTDDLNRLYEIIAGN